MSKYKLTDVSFLFPIRLDSIVRLENLMTSIGYLMRNFESHIIVLHADNYDNGLIKKIFHENVEYHFMEDYDDVFYRTKYINTMVKKVNTPILGVWDADVIVPANQIVKSIEDIRNDYDISYPYDGHFYDTSQIIRDQYVKTKEIRTLTRNVGKMQLIYGNDMKGGAFFANRDKYIYSGMENENFYGWGPEDFERFSRWKNLGYKISRVKGNLYHLTHSRGTNSTFRSQQQMMKTNKECQITMCSSKNEILEYLNSKPQS